MSNSKRWEAGYEKTWSLIRENEQGDLIANFDQIIRDAHTHLQKKRRALAGTEKGGFLRLGIMRHLYLVIDMSEAMLEKDLRPNRLACTVNLLRVFVQEYFDQNPISQLGIILMADKKIERLTELSGNPRAHLAALDRLVDHDCHGEPSLQNALIAVKERLKYLSAHSTREVVVVMGSQTTCDPGNIHDTIQSVAGHHIICSVISLAVEVFVYRALTQATKGSFHVVLDALHFKNILQSKVPPPALAEEREATLIRMGFPNSESFDLERFTSRNCMCHLDSTEKAPEGRGSYACPRCRAVYCELPVECQVCGLTLVAAPHLARAYHHLFPLPIFLEVELAADDDPVNCAACVVSTRAAFRCPKCQAVFCTACDIFLHESVHSCPTCSAMT